MTKVNIIRFFVIPVILFVVSLSCFLNFHGYGAWGGDTSGYIYSAAREYRNEPLVFQDKVAEKLIGSYDVKTIDTYFTPSRYTLLNKEGYLMNRYPVGISILLNLGSSIVSNYQGMFLLMPILASLNIVGVYFLGILFFKKFKYREWIGIIASVVYGFNQLTWGYALAQPMTETPTTTLLIYTVLALWLLTIGHKKLLSVVVLSAVAGFLWGFSLNVRHANIIFLAVIIVFLVIFIRNAIRGSKKSRKPWCIIIATVLSFCIFTGIGVLPTIVNNEQIAAQKEIGFSGSEYTKNSNDGIIGASNQLDIRGLKFRNFYDNQGKFETGRGSFAVLFQDVTMKIFGFPLAFYIVVIGIVFLWFKEKRVFVISLVWFSIFLFFYSFWVNPYQRYLIPALPALAIGFASGLYFLLYYLGNIIKSKKLYVVILILIGILLILSTYPVAILVKKGMFTDLNYKTISKNDYVKIESLKDTVDTSEQAIIFYLNPITRYRELRTLIEAQTEIPFREIPADYSRDQYKELIDKLEIKKVYFWVDHIEIMDAPKENPIDTLGIDAEKLDSFDFDFHYSADLYELKEL